MRILAADGIEATQRWAILDAQGEVYAITGDPGAIAGLLALAESYLYEAASCGHPAAPAWVDERLPLEVVGMSIERADELRAEARPVFEREP